MAANNQIFVGGMGRPFTLGMLYNAPKDELVPGIALWDSETLKNITIKRLQESSNFNITESDSTENKSSLPDVEASLKLSFMSGLIEVGGSARYLNDQKQFKNQSRVTLQYKATTHFEQLSLTSDVCKKIQNEMIEKGLATHVVTGIEYGANAFFVFDSEKLEASKVHDVKGQMQVVIKKIPECGIEGEAKLHLTEEEKFLVQTFSVKFYGDFLLESNPATFDAAVKTYVDLPKLLRGQEGNVFPMNAVPLRVWLLSLNIFNPKAELMVKCISVGLVIEAEDTLDNLAHFIRRSNDSLTDSTVGKFPQLQHQLSTFPRLCLYYTSELRRIMAETCPAIREGKEEERKLSAVFDKRVNTPFSHEKLNKWLDSKEREINVIRFITEIMKEIPILSTQSEVDRYVMSPDRPQCTGFIFTSVKNSDPFLNEMRKYLNTLKVGEEYVQPVQESDEPWYYSNVTVTQMKEKAIQLNNIKDSARFIAAIPDEENTGAALYSYRDGVLAGKNVNPVPPAPKGMSNPLHFHVGTVRLIPIRGSPQRSMSTSHE